MRKILFRLVILLSVLGAAWGAYMVVKQLPERQQQVPTAKVLRGDVVIRAYTRGEIRAVRFGDTKPDDLVAQNNRATSFTSVRWMPRSSSRWP